MLVPRLLLRRKGRRRFGKNLVVVEKRLASSCRSITRDTWLVWKALGDQGARVERT